MNSSPQHPGVLITLVGPAGVGKNRLMQHVLTRMPVLHQLPTATTRPIRLNEQQGREHWFVSPDEFERMIATDELLEHERIHGKLYGMPRKSVEAAFANGEAIIADIGIQGDTRAREAFPTNVISIFIAPPSLGSLIERMRDRGENIAEIGKRLLRVPRELAYGPLCHYTVLNDDLDRAADRLYRIISAVLAGQQAEGDPLPDYRFTYCAQAIPVYHDTMLQPAFGILFSDELPQQAAMRALRGTLHARADALLGGDKQEGDYLPPLSLDYARDENGERISYTYLYRLDQRIDVAGHDWAPLPDTLRVGLPEGEA